MGIPIENLSADSPSPFSTEDGKSEADRDLDPPSLPELFDEDELAEVGLVAGDGEPLGDASENDTPTDKASDWHDQAQPDNAGEEPPAALDPEVSPDPTLAMDEEHLNDDAGVADDMAQDFQDTDAATEMPPPQTFENSDLIGRIDQLGFQMAALQREFEGKLKYDAHKDEIIDKLHNELQEYKQDILKKHILSIVMDVVKVADDIRKWLTYFRSLEVSQRDPRKLFRYLEAIPSDLEDIFYWHGVRPFSTAEGIFDPSRQRAIKKIPSMDASQDKLIAESIRPGYEWSGKVIRQEMVAVYVYQDEQESSTMGMNNE